MKVRLFIMLCSLLSFSVCAEEFEYDYIQFGIATTDSKYTDKQYFVDLSKSVNDNISIKGLLPIHTVIGTTLESMKNLGVITMLLRGYITIK